MAHLAKTIPFSNLYAGLKAEEEEGYIRTQHKGSLEIFSYTEKTVFERNWNPFTRVARGLILDTEKSEIVALPFEKFFNFGELGQEIPDEPFEVYTKMDGSLIIMYYYDGKWNCATRGSFQSDQALLAQKFIDSGRLPLALLDPKVTYLFELIGPSNKIVISYPDDNLVFLGAINLNGTEFSHQEYLNFAYKTGIECANPHGFISIGDLCEICDKILTKDEEGFVLKFQSGLRLKIKGSEYKRIHSIISKLSPLSVWEIMLFSPEQMTRMKKELPEELWMDFDSINLILENNLSKIVRQVEEEFLLTKDKSDKEIGLNLKNLPEPVRSLIFPRRKQGPLLEGSARRAIFSMVRPSGNNLNGFKPSLSLNRTQGELFS